MLSFHVERKSVGSGAGDSGLNRTKHAIIIWIIQHNKIIFLRVFIRFRVSAVELSK